MAENQYPLDEFDKLAQDRTVGGAHRRKESNLRWWIALVAIVVLAPLAGWGVVNWADERDSASSSSTSTASESASATESTSTDAATTEAPAASSSASATATETTTPEVTPEKTAEPVLSAGVDIYNGSGVTGLAKSKQTVLKQAGYTNTAVGNWGAAAPRNTTIYYAEGSEATAKAVASALGIDHSRVVASNNLDGRQVRVVLRSDAS